MNMLKFFFREAKWRIILISLASMVSGISVSFFVKTVHQIIDPTQTTTDGLLTRFLIISLVFITANLCSGLPLLQLTQAMVFRFRLNIVGNILKARYAHLEKLGESRLFAALTKDVMEITNGFTVVPMIIMNSAIIIGCVIYLGSLSLKALLFLLPFVVAMSLLITFVNRFAHNRFHKAREIADVMISHFHTVTGGLKELKINAHRRSEFVNKKLEPTADSLRSSLLVGFSSYEIARAVTYMGYFLLIGVVLFVLPKWQVMDKSVMSGIVFTLIFMMAPLVGILQNIRGFSQADVSLKKLQALDLALVKQQNPKGDQLPEIITQWQSVELDGVSHTYFNERVDEQFTLGPANLNLKPGEILFITGGNGSGKSTLAKLITALYYPEEGVVRLDGKEIDESNRDSYRQLFSCVFSPFHLFGDFLGIGDDEIRKNADHYLAALHLDHKVSVIGNEISTTNLSMGQKKRLGLLIAYLEDRPIYLFDEWASDQDPVFKKIFYTELLPELKQRGKAVVVISHDDAYFYMADRLIKLENGQLLPLEKPAMVSNS